VFRNEAVVYVFRMCCIVCDMRVRVSSVDQSSQGVITAITAEFRERQPACIVCSKIQQFFRLGRLQGCNESFLSRGIATASRLSVTLRYRDHIGSISSKIIDLLLLACGVRSDSVKTG